MSDRFYAPDELAAMDKATLQQVADTRGLDVEGTGTDGNVLVGDLVAAINADQDARGLNPAVVPEPAQPAERTYTVVGQQPVLGRAPGEEFTAVLPIAQEARLIAGRHIKPKKEKD